MARVNFNDISTENNNTEYKVGFFSLKNGEEAIVRFVIDSVEDINSNLFTVHPITVGQSSYPNRRVSCLIDDPRTQDSHMCPLCARGEKVQQRFYIRMIQYVTENGRIIPKAVVWDRPAYTYAPQIKAYLDNYGPLSNIVCKITRHGEGLETKYDIIPNLNPQVYNEQVYLKKFDDFSGFDVLGTMVMDKTFDEINEFIMTGSFPQRERTTNVTNNNQVSPQVNPVAYDDTPFARQEYAPPSASNPSPTIPSNTIPNNPQAQMARPERYY